MRVQLVEGCGCNWWGVEGVSVGWGVLDGSWWWCEVDDGAGGSMDAVVACGREDRTTWMEGSADGCRSDAKHTGEERRTVETKERNEARRDVEPKPKTTKKKKG